MNNQWFSKVAVWLVIALVLFTVFKQFDRGAMQGNLIGYSDFLEEVRNKRIKSVTLQGPVQPGTGFRWKSGPSTLTSTLQVVDPPQEIGWTGRTMGIKAVHVFRFQGRDGGTLAHSEESWEGVLASLLKGYSRRSLDKAIRSILSHLKVEAERRAAAA